MQETKLTATPTITPNELQIVRNVILPIGRRLKANKCTDKLCQVLDVNMKLEPNSSFINLADIRQTKYNYLYNELQWYLSHDLCINHHQGIDTNPIWQRICTRQGMVNSNYGYLAFDEGNYSQYKHAVSQMAKKKHTKHAVMIYNRPSIVEEWCDGVHANSDFICTYAASFMVQDDELHMMVTMRSNDFTTGFFNDFGWQVFVYKKFLAEVKQFHPELKVGSIHWHTDNMHIYERDYELMMKLYDHYKGVR